MGMILGRQKAAAGLLAAASFAAVALWVAPTAQAATCQSVPGSTIGTDVSIAGQKARVPAISGIRVCVGSATAPLMSVQTSGGTCTFSCLSVLVGGDADAEGLTIYYSQDGVAKTVPVNPPAADGPASTCLLSVGSPDAPYPDCFVAIGPELGDPVGDAQPVVDTAVGTALGAYGTAVEEAGDAYETAVEEAGGAYDTACRLMPNAYDEYGYQVEFCDDAAGWALAIAANRTQTACDAIPDMQDPYYYYGSYDFCTDPNGWISAALNTQYEAIAARIYTVCRTLSRQDIYLQTLCG